VRAFVDYFALRELAAQFGSLIHSTVIVNRGCPAFIKFAIAEAGLNVQLGTSGRDCDPDVIQALVELAANPTIDVIILAAGDHAYTAACRLALLTAKKVIVVSTPRSCSNSLLRAAHGFCHIPFKKSPIWEEMSPDYKYRMLPPFARAGGFERSA
jgi:hypothetical protein